MIKAITINEKFKFKFKYTIKAVMIYQAQFGRGFIEDLQDIYNAVEGNSNEILSGILQDISPEELKKLTSKKKLKNEELISLLLNNVDLSKLVNRNISTQQYINACQIIWALLKNADSSLSEFDEWLESVEYLPMNLIQDLIHLIYQHWVGVSESKIELKKNWAVVSE